MERLLNVRNLRVWFDVRTGLLAGFLGRELKHVHAVDGISFDVRRGEVFCLVGESGCGKTTTGKALLRLNDPTGGNVFFEVPEGKWSQLLAAERRLTELDPAIAKLNSTEKKRARADWSRLKKLRRKVDGMKNPRGTATAQLRRQRIEKAIELLDVREKGLREGHDPAVTRITARGRREVEVLKDLGASFTPKRADVLDRTEKELKEAKFLLRRAGAEEARTRGQARRVRHLERQIAAMRTRVRVDDPGTQAQVAALERDLSERQRSLTERELVNAASERKELSVQLKGLKVPVSEGRQADIRGLEAQIETIRTGGGPGAEALELRAWVTELENQHDLATWTLKGKPRFRGRRQRRKQLKRRMRELRRRMQIIYQDPYESLNPKLSIFDIVAEPLLANRIVSSQSEAEAAVAKALEDVGLRPAIEYMLRYPHELSGGQRQRVGIATALVVDPDFIVADEPVSMLDASVRTEILALLLELKKRRDLTYLFITHDLGLAWILADRVAVMYLGKIVETGDGAEIIRNPRHPYTKALISVVPSPNPSVHREKMILRGERPNPVDIPTGCRFHPRCPVAVGICGWTAEEVQQEILRLLEEDRAAFAEARSVTDVGTAGPFALTLATNKPVEVEKYLWKRLQAVALGRPALGAIRTAVGQSGTLQLSLHRPVEPPLRRIKGDISVACHLVEPEVAESEIVEPEAVAVAE